jgi:hypothetical protein
LDIISCEYTTQVSDGYGLVSRVERIVAQGCRAPNTSVCSAVKGKNIMHIEITDRRLVQDLTALPVVV